MYKKLLSLILVLLMLVSAIPVSARATENADMPESFRKEIVNPLYADVVPVITGGESELPSSAPSGEGAEEYPQATKYYTSVASLAPVVREHMKSRESKFTVGYRFPVSKWTDAGYDAFVADLMDNNSVLAHTGDPEEGDYLRFHYFGGSTVAEMDSYDSNYVYVSVTFENMNYSTTAAQEATVDSYVSSLLSQLGTSGTNYQKIWRVYDWMCKNIRYDHANLNNDSYLLKYSAYAAVANKTAVCQGYSMLLYRMALELGVDCRAVYSIDSEDHIWNIVSMGNLYYNADATWDEGNDSYVWFLQSNATFTRDGRHTRSSDFNASFNSSYPMGQYDYDPNTAATIITQPQDVSAANGQTAKVTVQASGSGLTYAWYVKNPDSATFSKSDSFNGNYYSVSMNEERDGRKVYCRITDQFGNTVQTNTVTLSITKQTVQIVTQPQSVTVAEGAAATVSVKAIGDGLTYKWYIKDVGETKYTHSTSFTGNTYSVKMTEARDGRRVLCKVYDKYGNMAQTNSVLLNLKRTVSIITQPQNVTTTEGRTAKITVEAAGSGLTYKWYIMDVGETVFTHSTSFTGNTYSVAMTPERDGRQVKCVVTDQYGNSATTDTVVMKMAEAVKIVTQPKPVTVAEGAAATISVEATGDGLSYKWYIKDVGETKYTHSTSFTGNTYSVKMNEERNGRRVLVKVYDQYGNMVQSNSVLMKMQTPLKITTQPKSVTATEGSTVKLTVKATGDGLKYRWYIKDVGETSYTHSSSFTGNTYSVTMNPERDGRRVLVKVYDKYGNSVTSNTVVMKMAQTVKITAQPESVCVAAGQTAKITVKATGDGLTYRWYFKNAGAENYSYTSTFTGNTYSVTMNADRDGRRVLCKITDKYGNTVQSKSAVMTME